MKSLILLLLIALLLPAEQVWAQTCTWKDATSGNWGDTANRWTCVGVTPNLATSTSVSVAGNYIVTVAADQTVTAGTLNLGGTGANPSLLVNSDLSITAGLFYYWSGNITVSSGNKLTLVTAVSQFKTGNKWIHGTGKIVQTGAIAFNPGAGNTIYIEPYLNSTGYMLIQSGTVEFLGGISQEGTYITTSAGAKASFGGAGSSVQVLNFDLTGLNVYTGDLDITTGMLQVAGKIEGTVKVTANSAVITIPGKESRFTSLVVNAGGSVQMTWGTGGLSKMVVTGTATFNGVLKLNITEFSASIQDGQVVTVMTYGSYTGKFTSIQIIDENTSGITGRRLLASNTAEPVYSDNELQVKFGGTTSSGSRLAPLWGLMVVLMGLFLLY